MTALALWAATVGNTPVREMGDLGLVTVLPGGSMAAIALLSVSFWILMLQRKMSTPVAVLHVVVLIIMLYGVTSIIEEVPRLNVAWRHAGIAEHIMRTGNIDPTIDAYFNWPGFFVLAGTLTELAGFSHPLQLMAWAPVYFNLFYLVPLLVIVRRMTPDPRLQWLAVWLFFVANWVGQDYFSPQALGFAGYLVIVALVLSWLGPEENVDRRRAVGALTVAFLIFVAMVPSHQLTPFAVVAATVALVVARQCRTRALPLLLGAVLVAWITLMTEPYLAGRIHELLGQVGDVAGSADSNIAERLTGSPDHLFIVRVRLAMTVGLWVLAALGGLRRIRHGRKDLAIGALALAPFPLLGLQSYGGEMLLRVYLFALPFIAALAAAAFLPSEDRERSRLWAAAMAAILLVLPAGFLLSRYGNDRVNLFTSEEVATVRRLYQIAPRGAQLIAATGNLPWRSQSYDDYKYRTLIRIEKDRDRAEPRLEDLLSVVRGRPSCSYIIITRAERAYIDLLGVWPRGSFSRFEADLRSSPLFEVIFENADGAIFRPSLGLRDRDGNASGVGGGSGRVGCVD